MCRICLKRPEIPEEPHGRCEACARAGRIAYRFQLAQEAGRYRVRADELSPRALRDRAGAALQAFTGPLSPKPHLDRRQVELVVARTRLEAVRVAPPLTADAEAVLAALRAAGQRSDASW